MEQLFGRPEPDWVDRNSVVDYMTGSARLKSGSGGFSEQDVRAAAGSVFDRAGRTAKAQRASHLGTMFAALDCQLRWRERLGDITHRADPGDPPERGSAPSVPERGRTGRGDPGRHAAHTVRHRPGPAARDAASRRGRPAAPHLLTAVGAQGWRLGHWTWPTRKVAASAGGLIDC